MQRRTFLLLSGLVVVSVPLLTACHSEPGDLAAPQLKGAIKTMKLESTAFTANEAIPSQYTCDGVNTSPPLNWDVPPPNTRSLVLIVDDPDAPGGTFVHWVLYDLPPETQSLQANIPAQPTLPSSGVQGKNSFGNLGYGGPCPPSGTHRYFFKLYALDKLLELKSGQTKAQVLEAMEKHVLASAELVGLYSHKR